jgi:3',5'-cyclic AMP phosphodiesterase CpdA
MVVQWAAGWRAGVVRVMVGRVRTIGHISDLHFGALDAEVAEALVPYYRGLAVDLTIVSGDLTQRARPGQFAEAIAYLDRLAPSDRRVVVPGNHDVPLYAAWERFLNPLGRYKRYVHEATVYGDEELRVLGVSTPRAFVEVWDGFWKDGRVTVKQLAGLGKWGERKEGELRVVVTHHPFWPAPGTARGGVVLHSQEVLRVLGEAGVDVLLAGHLHASYHAQIAVGWGEEMMRVGHRMLSIQAGTATSSRRRHRPDGSEYPNAFNVLRFSRQAIGGVETDVLVLEVHSFGGSGVRGWGMERRVVFGRKQGIFEEVSGGELSEVKG